MDEALHKIIKELKMELKKDTSNYMINEEDSNKNLKYILEQLLEKELEKSPNEINTERIDSIVALLRQFDGKKEGEDIEKEIFAKKYLQKYIEKSKKERKYGIFISVKAACILLAVIMTLGFGNYLSVKATSRGILSNIKRKADIFYFEVIKKDDTEILPYENLSENQDYEELGKRQFSSWEELKEQLQLEVKIPYYIPEEIKAEKINYLNVGGNDFQLSRSYRGDDKYILLSISSFSDEGKFSILADEIENMLFEKTIGDFYVIAYKNQEDILAFFQDEQMMYSIETNLEEKELEQIILEMK